MHLLAQTSVSLDDSAAAVDLEHSPADIVCLSFTDSDLACLASAWGHLPEPRPSLRLAQLARLKHPFSVDLYIEKVISKARFVLVRLLGGLDYWRYGIDEIAASARASGAHLAILPGDHREDARLDQASTLSVPDLRGLWSLFQEGGPENMQAALNFMASATKPVALAAPRPIAPFGKFERACHAPANAQNSALIIFYRSAFLAGDTAPVEALAEALAARACSVTSVFVTSLKDPGAIAPLIKLIKDSSPQIILNTTAFSARLDDGTSVLDCADAPVLQVMLAGSSLETWQASPRGLTPPDLAMNIVLPEIDGRIITRAISFKAQARIHPALEFTQVTHQPHADNIAHVADLAMRYANLRATPKAQRRLACILSDYPAKAGRAGYAVGLDTPQSVVAIAQELAAHGYDIALGVTAAELMHALTNGAADFAMSSADYRRHFSALPEALQASVNAHWGAFENDPACDTQGFRFRSLRAKKMLIAVQPDRGHAASRRDDYHSASLPPRHAYIAFYFWLREIEAIDAMIQCGTHGTLEWLGGKAVALSASCAPQALLGAVPVIYPFIVNNPGEAAQAKRRIGAVTIGHLTPPLMPAGTHESLAEIEALLDEYANAQSLDPRRARVIAAAIRERADDTGLLADCGLRPNDDEAKLLAALDAWICDVKEMRIGDGLHIFGRAQSYVGEATLDGEPAGGASRRALMANHIQSCAAAEMQGLLRALDARFVPPGPAGAPARGRLDVLPTGRNLYTIDPRAMPSRTAWESGKRTAEEVVTRYMQDHGDWPRAILIDLWGSASMRTGGDDLAQALALIGVAPVWDNASSRVSGFEIIPLAKMPRPRVDVTLRISGLFRDVFPMQIDLFAQATAAIANLDEDETDNPLAASARANTGNARIYGAAPGKYGVGLTQKLALGDWSTRDELGAVYLDASSHAYDSADLSRRDAAGFRARVANTSAYVHVQDMAGQDIFDSDAFADHEGGFAAAAQSLGNAPALYHVDATRGGAAKVRTLGEEAARVLRGRAANPRWLAGQMRHGHRGAAEIAQTIDQVFAFAALGDVITSQHFELLFDATCGNADVYAFMLEHNRPAALATAARFEEALARGLWQSRRNSIAARLADLAGAA